VRYSGRSTSTSRDRNGGTEEALSAADRELSADESSPRGAGARADRPPPPPPTALEAEGKRRAGRPNRGRIRGAEKNAKQSASSTGGIAHDFNNILQVILGSLEIVTITLKRGGSTSPEASAAR
jgi:hypothetical protein